MYIQNGFYGKILYKDSDPGRDIGGCTPPYFIKNLMICYL